jgi:hypothetical protein
MKIAEMTIRVWEVYTECNNRTNTFWNGKQAFDHLELHNAQHGCNCFKMEFKEVGKDYTWKQD